MLGGDIGRALSKAHEPGVARCVDDAPAVPHTRDLGPHAVQHPLEIDGDGEVPVIIIDLPYIGRAEILGAHASKVDGSVKKRAEEGSRLVDPGVITVIVGRAGS